MNPDSPADILNIANFFSGWLLSLFETCYVIKTFLKNPQYNDIN